MHLLGNHNLVNFRNLKIWAERGLVRIENQLTGEYEVISVEDALLRINALSEMLGNSRKALRGGGSDHDFWTSEANQIQTMIEGVVEVCKKAKEQGMPTDASARRDLARRRPKSVFIPNVIEGF